MRTLDRLLEANRRYSSHYDEGLSNHLSMALIALGKMGASDEILEDFFERYAKRLEDYDGDAVEPAADIEATIARLSNGVGAAAFHGLIQTAFAVEHGEPIGIAWALKAWEETFLPLGRTTTFMQPFDFDMPEFGNIYLRMAHIANLPEFRAQLTAEGAVTDKALIEFAVRAYFATNGNFTALHLVTGLDAFLLLEDQCPMDRPSLVAALSAALLSIRTPRRSDAALSTSADWTELRERAMRSRNDHTIKLTYSCERLSKRTGDKRFLAVAAHRLGMTAG